MTTGIKTSCKRKRELFLLWRHNNDENLKTYYKKYCKILSNVILLAKKLHYNRLILNSNNKMATTWKIINHENGKSSHSNKTVPLRIENKEVTNQNKIANMFNNYFLSIAVTLTSGNNKHTNIKEPNPISYLLNSFHQPFPKMKWDYASTYEIGQIIKSLKSKNSSGYDEISTRILKLSAPYILSPLTHICNRILNTGIFPDRLKYAIIKPILKKGGDDQNISNYRPISLLTAFSKVIEKLMYNRLIDHITSHSILANEQFGFRTNHSTQQATFLLINNILTAMNSKSRIGGIFCDLQKAFDCMNHLILLDKLKFYGIKGKFKTLIESYLIGRYQKVILNNNNSKKGNGSSKWELIKHGVPQGSVLGPLLFLLYINDLPKIIPNHNSIVLFADDTSILVTDSNDKDLTTNINQSLTSLITWFNSNLLTLNLNKTHYIEFKRKNYYQVQTKVQYDHKDISSSAVTKFLGLIIDETISWNQHIDVIANKLCSVCYVLRNLKHIVPQTTLRTIYFAHIHSILSYGIIFWGNSTNVNKLFILQKKIVRILSNIGPRDSCREAFKNLEIMTLHSQYILSLILFTIDNKHLFTSNNELHNYSTRNNANLHLPAVNLSKFYKGPLISGIKAFNHLPQHLKLLASDVKCFKVSLKRFLCHHSFYTIKEYYEHNEDKLI